MTVFGASLAAVGIGKETTYGVPVAPALMLPVTTPELPDQVVLLADGSWRGAPATSYQHQQSQLESSARLAGPVYPDAIGFALAGILGQVAFTAGTPNTWTARLLNTGTQQPPSYTLTVADPLGPLALPGCRWSQLAFTFDPDQLLTWSGQLEGLPTTPAAAAIPAPSTESVIAGWTGTAMIGGLTEAQLSAATVTLARPVISKRNVDGTLAPWLQRSDTLTVTGSLTVVAATDLYRQQFVSGTSTSITLGFRTGTGAAARSLALQMSKVALTQVERTYGKKWIELGIEFTADANTTDSGAAGSYSPILATLRNAVPSGTYA